MNKSLKNNKVTESKHLLPRQGTMIWARINREINKSFLRNEQ